MSNMELGVEEKGFIFYDGHPLLMSKDSDEQDRALGPLVILSTMLIQSIYIETLILTKV